MLYQRFKQINVSTEAFIFDWFFTIYTRAVDLKVVRVLWDIILIFGDFCFIGVGISLFHILHDDLINARIEEGFNFLRLKTKRIPVSKIVKEVFNFKISNYEFYKMLADEILDFNQQK